MSELGGLWKQKNTPQLTLVPPKTECGCPNDGGINKTHTLPLLWRNAKDEINVPLTLREEERRKTTKNHQHP